MDRDEAAWARLIGDLYLSSVDREAGERLPGQFAALTGGGGGTIWQLRVRDLAMIGEPVTNLSDEALSVYRSHYYRHDPLGAVVRHAGLDIALRGSDVIDDATLSRSVYYNEFGAEHGLFHMIGALVSLGEGPQATLGAVSVLRPRAAGAYGDAAMSAMKRVLPHIREAFHLREQVGAKAATLRLEGLDAALEAFGVAALVLDGHGTVLRMNALAEEVPLVRTGIARQGNVHGVVRLAAAGGNRLAALVAAAARGEAGGRFRVGDGPASCVVTVSPLPALLGALAGGPTGRVLVLLRRVEPDRSGLAGLATALFGLTEAEAAVAAALADGLTPAEIAAARDVKVSTVRTLLQRAQDKMDCRTLRDVVRTLAGLA